jgi:hypothetical protein
MAYHASLTNIIGKTKDLTTKNIYFNMRYQRLILEKGTLVNTSDLRYK